MTKQKKEIVLITQNKTKEIVLITLKTKILINIKNSSPEQIPFVTKKKSLLVRTTSHLDKG